MSTLRHHTEIEAARRARRRAGSRARTRTSAAISGAHAHVVAVGDERVAPLVGHVRRARRAGSAPSRAARERVGADVGRDDRDRAVGQRAREHDRERVRLLAGGAARAPHADRAPAARAQRGRDRRRRAPSICGRWRNKPALADPHRLDQLVELARAARRSRSARRRRRGVQPSAAIRAAARASTTHAGSSSPACSASRRAIAATMSGSERHAASHPRSAPAAARLAGVGSARCAGIARWRASAAAPARSAPPMLAAVEVEAADRLLELERELVQPLGLHDRLLGARQHLARDLAHRVHVARDLVGHDRLLLHRGRGVLDHA